MVVWLDAISGYQFLEKEQSGFACQQWESGCCDIDRVRNNDNGSDA